MKHKLWLHNSIGGERANFSSADLRGVDFSGRYLPSAIFDGANLRGAKLSDMYLNDADFKYADLRDAVLSRSVLRNANLAGADLRGTDLRDADLSEVKFGNNELDGTKFDEVYKNIPVTLSEVRDVILQNRDRLVMHSWHSDDDWQTGGAKPIHVCQTTHCIAGWAHHLAALKRPELLDEKINVYLVGRLALGDKAASHFFDSRSDALEWLQRVV